LLEFVERYIEIETFAHSVVNAATENN